MNFMMFLLVVFAFCNTCVAKSDSDFDDIILLLNAACQVDDDCADSDAGALLSFLAVSIMIFSCCSAQDDKYRSYNY